MPEPKASNRIPTNSVLKKEVKALPSNWLIYEEMSRSTNVAIARHCSVVSPEAVFLFGGHSKVTPDMITETLDEGKSTYTGSCAMKILKYLFYLCGQLVPSKAPLWIMHVCKLHA